MVSLQVALLLTTFSGTGQPVLLDFYADWCLPCKELDKLTFSEARVAPRLGKMALFKVDLTSSSPATDALRERYKEVGGQPQFGDIVLLTLPDASSIHSAVYIADNIVFSKNGPSLAAPFIFTTIEDMLAFYPNAESIRLTYYRLK